MKSKTKKNIRIFVPLSKLKNSMLLDSGQEVIALKYKGYDISVRVCGDVRVTYKDNLYKASSQMPEELLEKFRDSSAYEDPDVTIIDNNWFEAFIDKDGTWTGWSTVVDDFENESKEAIASSLMDMVDEYIKDYQEAA